MSICQLWAISGSMLLDSIISLERLTGRRHNRTPRTIIVVAHALYRLPPPFASIGKAVKMGIGNLAPRADTHEPKISTSFALPPRPLTATIQSLTGKGNQVCWAAGDPRRAVPGPNCHACPSIRSSCGDVHVTPPTFPCRQVSWHGPAG
jgi:hypothetical protein